MVLTEKKLLQSNGFMVSRVTYWCTCSVTNIDERKVIYRSSNKNKNEMKARQIL